MNKEIDHCHQEIANAEQELRNGNPEIHGLLLCIADWWAELRLIEAEDEHRQTLR